MIFLYAWFKSLALCYPLYLDSEGLVFGFHTKGRQQEGPTDHHQQVPEKDRPVGRVGQKRGQINSILVKKGIVDVS